MRLRIIASVLLSLTLRGEGSAQIGEVKSTPGCLLVDLKRQSQYLVFERSEEIVFSGKLHNYIVLRLRNNTNCDVKLIVFEEPRRLQIEKLPDGKRKLSYTNVFPDGAFIENLKYLVELQEPPPPVNPRKKPIGIDEVHYHLNLKAGQSFLFKVPLERFDKWITIEVPFFYDWDLEPLVSRVYHRAYFGNRDLPDDIFSRTKVCDRLEWCKRTPSYKRLQRTRR